MIEFLSSWAKNLALAVMIVSILEMLLPNNKTKKYIKMVMGIYILFSIISPWIENNTDFDWTKMSLESMTNGTQQVSTETVNQESMDQRIQKIYQEQIQKDIIAKLDKKGYEVTDCKIQANLTTEEESKITGITLKVDKKPEEKEETQEEKTEEKLVEEIQKIKKVQISTSQKQEENQTKSTISQTDIKIIKKFLTEEYGVNEKCLKIS